MGTTPKIVIMHEKYEFSYSQGDRRLSDTKNQCGASSAHFKWNIQSFAILELIDFPNHEDFVDSSYGKIMRPRRQDPKKDHIEPNEMQNLNPELPDNP